jgi:hypothetical protein
VRERGVGCRDGVSACCAPTAAGGAGDANRQRAGRFGVEGVEVDLRHAPVEGDRLVRQRQRQRDREVGLDEAELAGGHRDAGLAAAVHTMRGGGAGGRADRDAKVDRAQRAGGAGEFQLVGFDALHLGGVQKFRAGGVAAGTAVVVGRIGVAQPDEQHPVEGLGGVGIAEPDRLPPLRAPCAHPLRQCGEGGRILDEHGLEKGGGAGAE